jgi:hypothetical protein
MNECLKARFSRQLTLKFAIPRSRKIPAGIKALRRLHRLLQAQTMRKGCDRNGRALAGPSWSSG